MTNYHKVGFIIGVLATLLVCSLVFMEWQIQDATSNIGAVFHIVTHQSAQ